MTDYLGGWMAPRRNDSLGGLAAARAAFSAELADPRLRSALLALAHAEVGGQGPQAQQAFLESVLNRAAARGKSLSDTIYDRNYFPSITHQRMAGGIPANMAGHYGSLLDSVVGGSNVSNYATGNASGTVGFAGGPQTFAHGGERFGIEGPDRAWARRMAGGFTDDAQAQPQRPVGMMALGGPRGRTGAAEAFRSVPVRSEPENTGNSLLSGFTPAKWETGRLGTVPVYASDDENALMRKL